MDNKAENDWNKNKAIGNIAENIVEMLISSMPNLECVKFGVENHINVLKHSLKDNNESETSKMIRAMPDFIISNKETKEVMLLDVKYRSFIDKRNGMLECGFGYAQIRDYIEHWKDGVLIIVHPQEPYFYCVKIKDIQWHKHFKGGRRVKSGHYYEFFDLLPISKKIKDIFPNLPEEALKQAIRLIPRS